MVDLLSPRDSHKTCKRLYKFADNKQGFGNEPLRKNRRVYQQAQNAEADKNESQLNIVTCSSLCAQGLAAL
jgi:hypothetical protein